MPEARGGAKPGGAEDEDARRGVYLDRCDLAIALAGIDRWVLR